MMVECFAETIKRILKSRFIINSNGLLSASEKIADILTELQLSLPNRLILAMSFCRVPRGAATECPIPGFFGRIS